MIMLKKNIFAISTKKFQNGAEFGTLTWIYTLLTGLATQNGKVETRGQIDLRVSPCKSISRFEALILTSGPASCLYLV